MVDPAARTTSRAFKATITFKGAATALLLFAGCERATPRESIEDSQSKLIYGSDDRLQYGQVIGAPQQRWTDSTAALFQASDVTCSSGACALHTESWTELFAGTRLCQDVHFRGEPKNALCTGFLVGPNIVATAGQCAATVPCADTRIVFGFTADANGGGVPSSLPESNVYSCVASRTSYPAEDWALFTLDRVVEGQRAPLSVRHGGEPAVGLGLAMIGYPNGVPAKVSPSGEVTSVQVSTFRHNVDSSLGDIGAPLFDRSTGVVEGIHSVPATNGWIDSTDSVGACVAEMVCPVTGCREFSVATRVGSMSSFIPMPPALTRILTD